MTTATATKEKKIKKAPVTPSAETNRRVLAECAKSTIDVRKVMDVFSCSRNNAVVLAAAAEHGLVPAQKK